MFLVTSAERLDDWWPLVVTWLVGLMSRAAGNTFRLTVSPHSLISLCSSSRFMICDKRDLVNTESRILFIR